MVTGFNIVEASIEDHQRALSNGTVTSVELVVKYFLRIAKYDIRGGLNAYTVFNDKALDEARASDERRAAAKAIGPLDGIPYCLKDSYKYNGMTVTNGSPALQGLMSNEDSYIASQFRRAGAVLLGKTNMPPMAAGGMQRGLYGRGENPYNRDYLAGAFSSGSSNGAATSISASLAAFGMASETVSSGRSPASNNGLIAYTPSRGIISCRGLWPLYVTCDVPVPFARSMEDMMQILDVIAEPDPVTAGDFWREQPHVKLPPRPKPNYQTLLAGASLAGKRIAVPKRYVGGSDSHPNAKPSVVSPAVIAVWQQTRADLERLGAIVVETDFPLVSRYEDDSQSGEANNVVGAPRWWNQYERGELCAKAWDDFLRSGGDERLGDISKVDPNMLFPKPKDYKPDIYIEARNWINYPGLPALAAQFEGNSIHDIEGMAETLPALEAQRKRDFEDWLDENQFDFVVFPAQGDAGKADLEFSVESAAYALQNGIKYSNGNRSLRHLGVPTVSVPMGVMEDKGVPVNLTFAGKAYSDAELLRYAYAFEQGTKRRTSPASTPTLSTDKVASASEEPLSIDFRLDATGRRTNNGGIEVSGTLIAPDGLGQLDAVQICLDNESGGSAKVIHGKWSYSESYKPAPIERLDWSLQAMKQPPVMVLVTATREDGRILAAKLLWI
ncbi:Glutamyl-tRNA(Gln) amidotransferase subunit A, mitochondrial [Cyphellophora attinorum]|uniref:Glutamyl-tRNA(Gln) amidotransferase subunit A, mitochondrial n=1 Tax=Cyphellophora attinorum TaxID=1664694 RepID=A0A0N1H7A1_9EURO|nr:Glutamyl-tRNA(Gln) amidotransferase subunit A, mitochondrial [Phialophora attinorum]KPI37417.1 Glutamyl-tRNA(Gln) amidotransferase subunit A, mitochondrial [Phialophora attinorum]